MNASNCRLAGESQAANGVPPLHGQARVDGGVDRGAITNGERGQREHAAVSLAQGQTEIAVRRN